jgi:ribosome biogenesis GTPase / thiamine phosphate phosphatase
MKTPDRALRQLGWKPFFSEQLSPEDDRRCQPVRVMSVHRGMVTVAGEGLEGSISSRLPAQNGPEDRPAVGDWLLIERDSRNIERILDRTSLLKRPAPADDRRVQLIAANVDTLFVVTSCNRDFNPARIERYLVLAHEAAVRPVLVLTKADLSASPDRFLNATRALESELEVELVDARNRKSAACLAAHCGLGKTVAVVGSSGVGKSTLVNTLKRSNSIATQAVRESDGKGLHTTTVREMHRLAWGPEGGGWLVDTPGMRELQMSEVSSGMAEVFDDITALTLECRFTNCRHADEPECAIRAAIVEGTLDPARLQRWCKLTNEDSANTSTATLRRARLRGRMNRSNQ